MLISANFPRFSVAKEQGRGLFSFFTQGSRPKGRSTDSFCIHILERAKALQQIFKLFGHHGRKSQSRLFHYRQDLLDF